MGLTLWIVPLPSDAEKLKLIMNIRPKTEVSTSASYPAFLPHITLAALPSNYDIDKARLSIRKPQKPVLIQFKSVDVGNHFFRSVYISVKPSDSLTALHAQVHSNLEISPKTPLFPHISLCYIADEDAQRGERQRYHKELEDAGRIRRDGNGVALNCAEAGEEDWVSEFVASEVWLAKCDGPVESWSVIEKIVLQ